jgi:hypothetical protein
MKISIFWDITSCSPLKVVGLFFDPEDGATYSSETWVEFQRTTRRFIPEYINLPSNRNFEKVINVEVEICTPRRMLLGQPNH